MHRIKTVVYRSGQQPEQPIGEYLGNTKRCDYCLSGYTGNVCPKCGATVFTYTPEYLTYTVEKEAQRKRFLENEEKNRKLAKTIVFVVAGSFFVVISIFLSVGIFLHGAMEDTTPQEYHFEIGEREHDT